MLGDRVVSLVLLLRLGPALVLRPRRAFPGRIAGSASWPLPVGGCHYRNPKPGWLAGYCDGHRCFRGSKIKSKAILGGLGAVALIGLAVAGISDRRSGGSQEDRRLCDGAYPRVECRVQMALYNPITVGMDNFLLNYFQSR